MSEVESKINRLRNISQILYVIDSFIMIYQAVLVLVGISFTINSYYVQSHHIVFAYSGLTNITAAFLIFAAIFNIAMIIAAEIMITRLFNYSVAVTTLSIVAAALDIVVNYLRSSNSPYAQTIKPFIDVTSAVVIAVSVGALYSVFTLKNLEKRLSE